MVGTSSSSSSSCASFGSLDDVSVKPAAAGTIKFLCSYGGKILPRYPDGRLRYIGGHTRVLAVDRSLPFSGSSPLPCFVPFVKIESFGFFCWLIGDLEHKSRDGLDLFIEK